GRARDGRGDRGVVANVELQRERLAARLLDLGGDRVDGASERRMRFRGLRGDRHLRAVARRAERDLAADAARRPGDEQRLACERLHGLPMRVSWEAGMIPRLT